MYFPLNTTPLIQPMDQGVLEAMKRRYKRSGSEEGRSVVNFVKSINIIDAVYMSAAAWNDIPASTITKSWNKLLVGEPQSSSPDGQSSSSSASDDSALASTLLLLLLRIKHVSSLLQSSIPTSLLTMVTSMSMHG